MSGWVVRGTVMDAKIQPEKRDVKSFGEIFYGIFTAEGDFSEREGGSVFCVDSWPLGGGGDRFQRFQFSVTDFAFQHRSAINIICKDNSLLYYII